ncbi:MAG: MarR family transcriptional regulator [Sphingobacteriales bacterium]|nr:MAG: MarR family transcriptional regulator [Sphingobacteriales bacterium]
MKLEEEIFNKAFDNNYNKVLVNILFTHTWVSNMIKKELLPFEITMQQYNVLRILRGQHPNPATVNLVKERMLDKVSDASRLIERLVQKELLTRCSSRKDRRVADVLITKKGLKLLETVNLDEVTQNKIAINITDEEASLLSDLLDKIRG